MPHHLWTTTSLFLLNDLVGEKSFPVNDSYCGRSVEVEVEVGASDVAGEDSSAAVRPSRLVRRAMVLKREMQTAGSLDCVSP